MGSLLAFSLPGWGRALGLLPLCLVVLHPKILLPLSRALSRVLRRPPVTEPPSASGVSKTVGWLALQWTFLGIANAVLANGMGADVAVTRVIGATALAWAAGLLVVVVPAGAGVREGVFTVLLAPVMGSGPALAVALLGRLAVTFADALFAAGGVLVTRGARRHRAGAALARTPPDESGSPATPGDDRA
jgi:uncharacterized membrane protein YbhN (UPF0104 family)